MRIKGGQSERAGRARGLRRAHAATALALGLLLVSPATGPAQVQSDLARQLPEGVPGAASRGPGPDPWARPRLNFMGVPGIFDMPTAHQMRDADLSLTLSTLQGVIRTTAHFQITPRLSGVFRYGRIAGYFDDGEDLFDRSFDLRFQIAEETARRPAITLGLQDFGGTGIYSSEYLVATKTFGRLRATAGLGWGRLSSQGGFDNPLGLLADGFRTRPVDTPTIEETGQLDTGNWFRGDAALFGGLQYAVNDRLTLMAEYSSDAYVQESARIGFDRRTPLNLGLTYKARRNVDISAAWMYGSTLAVNAAYVFNPKTPNLRPGGLEGAPPAVFVRPRASAADLGWSLEAGRKQATTETVQAQTAAVFDQMGLELQALRLDGQSAVVQVRNLTYPNQAQALGRAARALTGLLPASVERIVLEPVTASGLPGSRITLMRRDLEDLEYAPDGSWTSLARARIRDAVPPTDGLGYAEGAVPRFRYQLGPYVEATYFDPNQPVRLDYGLQANASYSPRPGLVFSGQVKQKLGGNTGDIEPSNSTIQKVRSDAGIYARDGTTALKHLTVAQYFRPRKEIYGRVTAGYLETMYAGVSAELLWKPVESNFGLGVELNHVRQRDFDQGFGLQGYSVTTGHVSAYLAGSNGFHYQLDLGRYLGGDWGGTLSVDREFRNGVRIGAFATLTDIPFDDFGEGSFDKGIRFDIPLSVITGQPSQRRLARTIRPVTRDGGARLEVQGRLYESVRDFHQPELQAEWGKFWR